FCVFGVQPTDTFDQRKEKIQLRGHTATVRWASALSSSSILTGSRDTTLKVWNIETGECETTFEGHTATVRSVARHGDIVVSASYDHDARVWSLEKKDCLHVLKGHTAQLYGVDFDGKQIVTGSLDKTARVWNPESGTCVAILEGYTSLVSLIQLLPSAILTGDAGGFLRRWSRDTYSEIWSVKAQTRHAITTLECLGSKIVTGGSEGVIKLWDLESGSLVKELANSDAAWKVGFLGEGRIIALCSRNKEVILEVSGTLL
ncbi:F-box/WD repeat-containing protein, partial [Lachnellula suecica]